MSDVVPFTPRLDGLVPASLGVRSCKIHLQGLEVMADIGFHDFEVGAPQRVLIGAEVWLDKTQLPESDNEAGAWNYDHLRIEIERIASSRRFNLQETLALEIYNWIAARHGVRALRVTTSKPDIYPNAQAVGVEFASFFGTAP